MIRSEFTSRIATQIGIPAESMKSLVEKRPDVVRTMPTESFESVELGFEKVAGFFGNAAEKYRGDKAGLDSAATALEKENPKAFSAFQNFMINTCAGINDMVAPHDFVSFGDGVCAFQVTGNNTNGTLWVDTTPGQNGIETMLLSNAKTKGPNPCIAPPKPREGEVTSNLSVDSHVYGPVAEQLGADKLFTGLDDPKLTRFTSWALGQTDLPIGTPLQGLPEGWQELSKLERGHIGEGENYILGSPYGNRQVLAVNKATGEITLFTEHEYRREGDFEGSSDSLKLTRYADGEVRRFYHEMHD